VTGTEGKTARERVEEQTRVRKALLANGYSCFPCEGKNGQPTGWPSIVATEALIEEWSDQLRWVSTAVHVGPGRLVGLDVDIDDAVAMEDFESRIPEPLWERLRQAPKRRGGGCKEMWLVRLAEGQEARQFKETTGKWGDPDSGADDTDHKLEIWAKPSKLLVLYGARTVEGREVVDEYSWVGGRGPCEVAVGDLPELRLEDFDVLLRCAVEAMQARGWDRLDVTEQGEGDNAERVFDLHDGMVFKTRDFGDVGLAELIDLCSGHDEVRMYSWLPGKRRRADRCAAKLNDYDGLLQIHDFDTDRTHRMAEADGAYTRNVVAGVRDTVAALREALGRQSGGAREASASAGGGDGDGDGDGDGEGGESLSLLERLALSVPPERRVFAQSAAEAGGGGPSTDAVQEAVEDEQARREAVVAHILGRYAYWSDGTGYVVDVLGGPEKAMSLASFRNLMLPFAWKQKRSARANAAEDLVNPADVWLARPERMVIGGYRFLPGSRERLVVRGEDTFVNIWERPEWWDSPDEGEGGAGADEGAVEAFMGFLAHLIPDPRERDWFIMWLGAKVQKPWLPNCGVLMVAERQGAGRGTLFDMLSGVFGPRHVKPVTAVQLIGGGSQSQYTDWLEAALLVTCDEVLAGDDAGGAMTWKRREVYERLKALVDPRARLTSIVRKGLPNYQAEVFASYLLATNNVNALPLSVDDRRFAVVTNTVRQLAENTMVMRLLAPWRDETLGFSAGFSAALYRWLLNVRVDWAEVRESPRWMKGRAAMLAANEGDLDEILENVLRRVEGDFVLGPHLRERLGRSLEAAGLLNDTKGWWNKAQDILSRPNRLGWRKMQGRHRFDAASAQGSMTVVAVFYREEGVGVEGWLATPPSERRALWDDGDPSAKGSGRKVAEKLAERGMRVVEGGGGTPAE
jgi:hypothetical protein